MGNFVLNRFPFWAGFRADFYRRGDSGPGDRFQFGGVLALPYGNGPSLRDSGDESDSRNGD